MEIGSLTDWLSALGSLGTLYIAYRAYKKAPEWISQQSDQHAYTLIKRFSILVLSIERNAVKVMPEKLTQLLIEIEEATRKNTPLNSKKWALLIQDYNLEHEYYCQTVLEIDSNLDEINNIILTLDISGWKPVNKDKITELQCELKNFITTAKKLTHDSVHSLGINAWSSDVDTLPQHVIIRIKNECITHDQKEKIINLLHKVSKVKRSITDSFIRK